MTTNMLFSLFPVTRPGDNKLEVEAQSLNLAYPMAPKL